MSSHRLSRSCLLIAGLLLSLCPNAFAQRVSTHASANTQLRFTENRGQLHDQSGRQMPEVRYYLQAVGAQIYFTQSGEHFIFERSLSDSSSSNSLARFRPGFDSITVRSHRVDLKILGASNAVNIEASDVSSDVEHFYGARTVTNVHSYSRLIYRNVYPKIDMVLRANKEGIKREFIVRPGGDPSRIKLLLSGADSLSIDPSGELSVRTSIGAFTEAAPVSFVDDKRIATRFELKGDTLSYRLGHYPRSKTLVIDPARVWGTYYGGSGIDRIYSTTTDADGNVYCVGVTNSTTAIATSGSYQSSFSSHTDGFLVKFNAAGVRQWATYLGGFSDDDARDIALTTSGDLIVTGTTSSYEGISTTGAYQTAMQGFSDAYLMKFTQAGAKQWGTYYGSSKVDVGYGVAVDSSNNIYLGGGWNGNVGYGDMAVSKFNSSGSYQWRTTYGNTAVEYVPSIECDASGNTYAASPTKYANLATVGAHQTTIQGQTEVFLFKLSSAGALVWGTYYGGALNDSPSGLALDNNGYLYLTGWTNSTSGIATANGFQTATPTTTVAYLSKWSTAGVLQWGTYYGTDGDIGLDVAVDNHDPYFCGVTSSSTGIATAGAYQSLKLGNSPGFLAKFNADGSRAWGTYYGSGGGDIFYSVHSAPAGYIIAAGETSSSSNILATSDGHQTLPGTGVDGFVVKFCGIAYPAITLAAPTVGPLPNPDTICQGTGVTLTAQSGYSSYQWRLNSSDISGATTQSYVVPSTLVPGTYKYSLAVSNADCGVRSDTAVIVVASPPQVSAGSDRTVCSNDVTVIGNAATGGRSPYQYSWTPTTGLDDPTLATPKATPTTSTTYSVHVTDANGCENTASVRLTVNTAPAVVVTHNVEICEGSTTVIGNTATSGTAPYTYSWTPSTGLSSASIAKPVANPLSSTRYYLTIRDAIGCTAKDSVDVIIHPKPKVTAGTNRTICDGASTPLSGEVLSGTGPYTYSWTPTAGLSASNIAAPVATPQQTTLYTLRVTDGYGCEGVADVRVSVSKIPIPSILPAGPITLCLGDTLTLTAPPGYSSYLWSTGATTPTIRVWTAGSYLVTVADENACSATSTATEVTVSPKPVLSIEGPNSACPSSTATYTVSGTPGVGYEWKLAAGGTLSTSIGSTTTVSWGAIGSYTLVATARDNTSGCTHDTSIAVKIESTLNPVVTLTGSTTLCQGDSVILTAPAGYRSYQWSNSMTSRTIVVRQSGNYSVTVQGEGGCRGSSTPVTITRIDKPRPIPTITADRTLICVGDSVLLSCAGQFAAYRWSNGATGKTTYARKGTHSLAVVNADGCEGVSNSITIDEAAAPTLLVTSNSVVVNKLSLCDGATASLDASAGFASYTWFRNSQVIASASSISASTPGVYQVVCVALSGCVRRSDSIVVSVGIGTKPEIVGPRKVCALTRMSYSLKARATPTSSIVWSVNGGTLVSGQGTPDIIVQWSGAGVAGIDVIETTTEGCSGNSSIAIAIGASLEPVITTSGKFALCGAEDSVVLDAGSGFTSYLWSTSESTRRITVRSVGTYTVHVAAGGGCEGDATMHVVAGVPPQPVIFEGDTISLCEGDSRVLHATTGFAGYTWTQEGVTLVERSDSLLVTSSGNVSVLAQSAEGCVGESRLTFVRVIPRPAIPLVAISGSGLSTTADPGSRFWWYEDQAGVWVHVGKDAPEYSPATAGRYKVVVMTSAGCSSESSPIAYDESTVQATLPAIIVAEAGSKVTLPIELHSANTKAQEYGYSVVISYNPRLLSSSLPYTLNGGSATLRLSGVTSSLNGVLASPEFIATLGDDSCTDVRVDSLTLTGITVQRESAEAVARGSFCLKGLCVAQGPRLFLDDGTFRLEVPSPNPANDYTTLEYELIEDGLTSLTIYDALGRAVMTPVSGAQQRGAYRVNLITRDLSQGTYYITLQCATGKLSRRISILK